MMRSGWSRRWQLQWHEILNAYPDPDGYDSYPLSVLPDMGSDFRLHFNLWQTPAEARLRAFAILPVGKEMLARVEQHLSAERKGMDAEQAIAVLRAGLKLARNAGWNALPSHDMHIDILSEADLSLLDAFRAAGDPFEDMRDQLSDQAKAHHGEIGWDAYFFLREPLYRLQSNYQVADWVRWPLCSAPGDNDLTEAGYLLAQGGWSAGWTGNRLFIFDRRTEFGLG